MQLGRSHIQYVQHLRGELIKKKTDMNVRDQTRIKIEKIFGFSPLPRKTVSYSIHLRNAKHHLANLLKRYIHSRQKIKA